MTQRCPNPVRAQRAGGRCAAVALWLAWGAAATPATAAAAADCLDPSAPAVSSAAASVGRQAVAFGLAAGIEHQRVDELLASGRRLLREEGAVPFLAASAAFPTSAGALRAGLDLSDGSIDYSGATQGGQKLSTRTHYRTVRAGLAYEHRLTGRWTLAAGLAHEWRDRDIADQADVSGLDEHYRNTFALAGLRWRVGAIEGPILSADWIQGLASSEQVAFRRRFETVTLRPGLLQGWRLALEWPLTMAAEHEAGWALVGSLEWLRADASPDASLVAGGASVGSVRQPQMHRATARIGLVRRWSPAR